MAKQAKNSRKPMSGPTVSPSMLTAASASDSQGPIGTYIRQLLRGSGWLAQPGMEADFVIHRGGESYAVVVKMLRESSRTDQVRAYLADAYLRALSAGRKLGAKPLALIVAPAISERMARVLRDYAQSHLVEGGWGLLDGQGRAEFVGIDVSSSDPAVIEGLSKPARAERIDPFTDLNQWMLKVLLAPQLPPEAIHAPRARVATLAELATAAAVSEPHAKRLVRHLRNTGQLEPKPFFRLTRIADLLEQWAAVTRSQPVVETPARLLIPEKDVTRALQRQLRTIKSGRVERRNRVAFALFAAADALGFGHVTGTPIHLYVENSDPKWLEGIGLVVAAAGEMAQVMLRVPAWPESVFRGAIERDGILYTDMLQVWLDVQHHPARGAEQAELIGRRLLAPLLKKHDR